jgi:hypothetical protein
MVIVSPEGDLKIKIFSFGSVIRICKLPTQKWITLALSYTLKNKLLRNQYDLLCSVDSTMFEKKDLPVPSISMTDEIVEMTLARNFYGRLHSFILSRSEVLQGYSLSHSETS